MGCLKIRTIVSIVSIVLLCVGSLFSANDFIETSSLNYEILSSDNNSINLQISSEEIEHLEIFRNGERFDRYIVNDEAPAGQEGWPELPAVVRHVLIPPQSGVELFITDIATHTEYNVNPYPRQPVEPEHVLNENIREWIPNEFGDLFFDPASREHDGMWPPETVQLGKPAIMRGYRIVPIIIHPLRYNPTTRELEVLDNIQVELDFTSDENRVNLVTNPERPRPSKSVYKIISDLVVNPPAPRRDEPENGSIAYVLGTGNGWDDALEELEPLIEWRRRMGWSVGVIRVGNPTNRNAVKDAIQEAYDEWENPPEHIVLIGEANASNFIIAYWDVGVNLGWPYESDHPYVELEGDDVLPEASIGRMVFTTLDMLRGAVEKTINYESDPYIGEGDDAGWQKRGACAAVDQTSGVSSIDVSRWVKDVLITNDYEEVDELFWTQQVPQPDTRQWVIDAFQSGISFFTFRGFLHMGRAGDRFTFNDVQGIRNGGMLPFAMIITCNTGDYAETISSPFYFSERFAFDPNGGAIGATGAGGSTHTGYNNLYVSGATRALFADSLVTQGWVHSRGLIDLYRNYSDRGDIEHNPNRAMESWECHYYIINLMGDPAVTLFTDVPRELNVEHAELRSGDSRQEVHVTYADNDENAAGIQVCMYKPDGFQLVEYTDEDGIALFALDPNEIDQNDDIQLTVSGYNLMPYLADLEVETANYFIGASSFEIDDDNEGNSIGDGDGTPNPTETLEITVEITNFGSEVPEGEMSAVLSTNSPLLEVLEDHNSANFNQAPNAGETVSADFVVNIGGAIINGSNALFELSVQVGDATWLSEVAIPIEGAELEIIATEWDGDPLERASSAELQITLANIGTKNSTAITAEIISRTITVGCEAETSFDAIAAGESGVSNQTLTISATPMHLNSSIAELELRVSAENGFEARLPFTMVIGTAGDGDAFGPDRYGYICVDDTDDEIFVPPTYQWIEIDPEEDGNGTDTELSDTGAERDESTVVDLPFEFQYYGEQFNQVTICTNGWIALGDHSDLVTARNRRIPGGMVAPAMVCPFWDDLKTTNDGGVFYWYDEDNGWFIVEWNHMKRLTPGAGEDESFQVLLYDPAVHPSFSGDGDIVFQYDEVEDGRAAFDWDTPYATVGIGSPDLRTGIQYTYWNELSPGAAVLESERAIKFTTMRNYDVGAADGYVYDVATEEPIAGAIIQTSFGYTVVTNDSGYYYIPDMLVVDDLDTTYTFTASKLFYNDSSLAGIRVIEDEVVSVNFSLLHPEFGVEDSLMVDLSVFPDSFNSISFPLINSGNGTLTFSSEITFRDIEQDPERDELFDQFMSINVTEYPLGVNEEGDTIRLGNPHIVGTVFVDSMFYVTGGGEEGDFDSTSNFAQFYRFTRNGEFIDSLAQPWVDDWGMRGMAYDGEYIWGCFQRNRDVDPYIYKFTREGEMVDSIFSPRYDARTMAIDKEQEVFYICGLRSDIFAIDMNGGEVLNSWTIGWNGDRVKQSGLAWYPDQPDSLKLLIYGQLDSDPCFISGFNPGTEEIQLLSIVEGSSRDTPLGIDISDRWNTSVWTLITSVSNSASGDGIAVWELEPNTTWLNYTPMFGTLEAGQDTTIDFTLSSGIRPLGSRYWIYLTYTHNAAANFNVGQGIYEIPIMMLIDTTVVPPEDTTDFADTDLLVPLEFGLKQNYPNPFNPVTAINFSIPFKDNVTLTVWDITGRKVQSLVSNEQMSAGNHTVTFDGTNLPNGVYLYQLESNGLVDIRKMVLLK